jgi:hypothetical protein
MALTTVYLNNEAWRRADGSHATVRVFVGPLANFGQPPAVFVGGVATVDDALAAKLLALGLARLTP